MRDQNGGTFSSHYLHLMPVAQSLNIYQKAELWEGEFTAVSELGVHRVDMQMYL